MKYAHRKFVWLWGIISVGAIYVVFADAQKVLGAKAVFGFNENDTITLPDLKQRRKKLILNERDNEERKQAINEAFLILEEYINGGEKSTSTQQAPTEQQKEKWRNELLPLAVKLLQRVEAMKYETVLQLRVAKIKEQIAGTASTGWFADADTYQQIKKELADLEKEVDQAERESTLQQQSKKLERVPVEPYKNFQEAFDMVVMGYSLNKQPFMEKDALAWADILSSLQGYIKNINTNRGVLEKISAKNIALFEKANDAIRVASAVIISAKLGRLANKEQQLKIVINNLSKLQEELKPVTSGLLADYEITRQVKELLSMLAAKLVQTADSSK